MFRRRFLKIIITRATLKPPPVEPAQAPTIISTNLLPAEIGKRYSDRLVSRLFGSYKTMNFLGKDIRIQKTLMGQ